MKACDLYNQLENDFVKPEMKEDWYANMAEIQEYVCDNFKQRSMGLLCDFAQEINRVYTAVFPSDKVLMKILEDNVCDAMLFLHHPMDWDLSKDLNTAFYVPNPKLLRQLRESRVSLFNFHYPLDNYSNYSNSKALAEALGVIVEKPFAEFSGALCGVIGITHCSDVHELNAKYSQAVGHETKLYNYGEKIIFNNRVAIVAGGGNDTDVVHEVVKNGVNVLVSGLSLNNKYSSAAHEMERENGINLLGGTHYSSEKFGCIAMCDYFKKLELPCAFISDSPCFEDL
ncbi:MAG: Nif3-like dinuclear metal center hexameric protein [Defluviitaleaceae bacterium]|nr:Nif3-like dinuclear metal center hexameric protein [Defluviitaleaceae bacterium]MCL2273526.1 Nif3-like dinuclear metal center hexameric protein [Defluviitaleaceae bacterium]